MKRHLCLSLLAVGLALSACSSYRPAPPAFHAAIGQPYLLDAGDNVRVTVFDQANLTNTYAVDQGGYVSFPLIGSVAARGKIVAAEKAGKAIPGDWAVDADGNPTTDPKAALGGALLPIGGAKGGALALMIEIFAAAVTGSAFGWEASSFFDDKGGPPNMGHVLIAIDAEKLSAGAFDSRMSALLAALAAEPDARLPGTRRLANRARAAAEGVTITPALHEEIRALIDRPA